MSKILLPTIMRRIVQSGSTVIIDGSTIEEVLHGLVTTYPELHKHIFDDAGRPVRHLLVVLNGDDIRTLDGIKTTVRDGDEVQLLPAMAGG
jgi:sulfur-carrier protein